MVDRLNTLLEHMTIESTSNIDAVREALQELGEDDPSESMIRRLIKAFRVKRCLNCTYCGNLEDVEKHMRARKHFYGQGKYANEKRRFLVRLQEEISYCPGLSIDPRSELQLSDEEKDAFRDSRAADLNEYHRATRDQIIFIGCVLLHLSRRRR